MLCFRHSFFPRYDADRACVLIDLQSNGSTRPHWQSALTRPNYRRPIIRRAVYRWGAIRGRSNNFTCRYPKNWLGLHVTIAGVLAQGSKHSANTNINFRTGPLNDYQGRWVGTVVEWFDGRKCDSPPRSRFQRLLHKCLYSKTKKLVNVYSMQFWGSSCKWLDRMVE